MTKNITIERLTAKIRELHCFCEVFSTGGARFWYSDNEENDDYDYYTGEEIKNCQTLEELEDYLCESPTELIDVMVNIELPDALQEIHNHRNKSQEVVWLEDISNNAVAISTEIDVRNQPPF